jgi:U3 small nucleolar RNA-associated protein 15
VGMSNGSLSIRERVQSSAEEAAAAAALASAPGDFTLGLGRRASLGMLKTSLPRGGTSAFMHRGADYSPTSTTDILVERDRLRQLSPFDKKLKAFEYAEALDLALRGTCVDPHVVVSLVEELIHRAGLHIAIANRSEQALLPLLSFLARYTTNPLFAPVLMDVAQVVFDTYGPALLLSKEGMGEGEAMVERLKARVDREITTVQGAAECMGLLDTIFAASY